MHELIDRLPPAQLTAVAGLLETMLDREQIGDDCVLTGYGMSSA